MAEVHKKVAKSHDEEIRLLKEEIAILKRFSGIKLIEKREDGSILITTEFNYWVD